MHFARLSSAEGVDMVRQAKRTGLPVTCDVGVHHAHLSEMDIGYFDPNNHLTPPLRSVRDRDALRAALADGTVDAICSDHTPVDMDVKQLPFAQAEAGATGLELLLPLDAQVGRGNGPAGAVRASARSPAKRRACSNVDAGHLTPGHAADVCIFDPERYWKVGPETLKSQGKNTPFSGIELKGRVRCTLVDGQVVYEAQVASFEFRVPSFKRLEFELDTGSSCES